MGGESGGGGGTESGFDRGDWWAKVVSENLLREVYLDVGGENIVEHTAL